MKASFKGTDLAEVNFNADSVKLINQLLEQTSIAGASLEVGESLDTHFAQAHIGTQTLSHDMLALLKELFIKASFTKIARPVASQTKKIIVVALDSFYKES